MHIEMKIKKKTQMRWLAGYSFIYWKAVEYICVSIHRFDYVIVSLSVSAFGHSAASSDHREQ